MYTTGSWKPFPGQEEAFVEAWTEFASWASELPGAGTALLARDLRDRERFVSFMDWESMTAVRGWKDSPEFKERMGRVQKHIDKFAPTESLTRRSSRSSSSCGGCCSADVDLARSLSRRVCGPYLL